MSSTENRPLSSKSKSASNISSNLDSADDVSSLFILQLVLLLLLARASLAIDVLKGPGA